MKSVILAAAFALSGPTSALAYDAPNALNSSSVPVPEDIKSAMVPAPVSPTVPLLVPAIYSWN